MKIIVIIVLLIIKTSSVFSEEKIAYIDINLILNNSIVGKSLEKHILLIKKKNLKEFTMIEENLKKKEENIISKKNVVSKIEFEKNIQSLKKEISEYKNIRNQLNKEMNEKKIKYTNQILNSLNPIIANYVDENSISMVLNKKYIVVGKKKLDITKNIISLLDKNMKEIKF